MCYNFIEKILGFNCDAKKNTRDFDFRSYVCFIHLKKNASVLSYLT